MSENLKVEFGTKTILELRNLQSQGHLNLEPGFQRKSVWTLGDRRKLIQSVFEGYPVPSVFLYRREENGLPVYDVVDGKQRLETVFMFSRVRPFSKDRFEVKYRMADDEDLEWWDWKSLEKSERVGAFLTYKVQIAEVSGDLADIVDLFVRINSTGKALTSSEKRHAKFYTSPFLKVAERLARRYRQFLTGQQIITTAGIERMRDVELISELLASIVSGGPIHKKQAVDRAVGNAAVNVRTLKKTEAELSATFRAIKNIFQDLRATRFRNISEFYTLFMVIWEMHQQKMVLSDKRRNEIARRLLRQFSDGVDNVREQQRRAKGAKSDQRLFANYLLLVQQSTDALSPRKARAEIIRRLLGGLFERKDERRLFTAEQRRLLWNTEEKKSCSMCGEPLDWTNCHIDHKKAYVHGGRTSISNAALACASCNLAKGAKRKGWKRAA